MNKRMQSLQITRTAVSYDMISWRIGRNRVLVGDRDGAAVDNTGSNQPKKKKGNKSVKERDYGTKASSLT